MSVHVPRLPHDLQSPTCWCHPVAMTPAGCYQIWQGRPVALPQLPPVYPPVLNHQDAIGAASWCIAGVRVWHPNMTPLTAAAQRALARRLGEN